MINYLDTFMFSNFESKVYKESSREKIKSSIAMCKQEFGQDERAYTDMLYLPMFDMSELYKAVRTGATRNFKFINMFTNVEIDVPICKGFMTYGDSKLMFVADDVSATGYSKIVYDEKYKVYRFLPKYNPTKSYKRHLNLNRPCYKMILDTLETRPMTAQEIAGVLGIEINRVSGRLTELAYADAIVKVGTRQYPNRKANIVWKLVR